MHPPHYIWIINPMIEMVEKTNKQKGYGRLSATCVRWGTGCSMCALA